MKISNLLLFALLFLAVTPAKFFKQVDKYQTQARCLDGSLSFIYLQQNVSQTADGLIVYFMPTPTPIFCGGSSLSNTLQNCIQIQSQVTSYWQNQLQINVGILADPKYSTWQKVIIPNCDGSLYQGYAQNPTRYKNKDLYFRANLIIKSNIKTFSTKIYNINSFKKIVFAGSGFGAIGALTWSRYFHDQILLKYGEAHTFSLILDSYPTSYPSYKTKNNQYNTALINLAKIANQQQLSPFILCTLRNQGQQWKCLNFQQSYIYLNFKVMVIDSQYDLITISKILQLNCLNNQTGNLNECSSTELAYIQQYRSDKLLFLYSFVNFHDNSVWSISCASGNILNSAAYNNQNFKANWNTVSSKVYEFIEGGRITDFDHYPWPNNYPCAGQINEGFAGFSTI